MGISGRWRLSRNKHLAAALMALCAVTSAVAQTGGAVTAPKLPPSEQVRRLFAKGTITGEDLKEELLAVRKATADPKSEGALAGVVGQSSTQIATTNNQGFFSDLGAKLKDVMAHVIRQQAASYSTKVLGTFMTTLALDDTALRKETITLPADASKNLSATQQQSVLLMAALVVGTRIAHHILDSAHADFAGLEAEYGELLRVRQTEAAQLADVLDKRRAAKAANDQPTVQHLDADLKKSLAPEDLQMADAFGSGQTFGGATDDLGLQNLSMEYMQSHDPKGFASYRTKERGLVGRSRAYVRATSGVAAFGAFSIQFVQEIAKTVHDKNMFQIMAALPFAGEYVKEAGPLIKLSTDSAYSGLVTEPKNLRHHYRLVQAGKTVELGDADAVYKELGKSKDLPLLTAALFRDQSQGMLHRLYLCDPGAAGEMVDLAVKPDKRAAFAEQYLHVPDPDGFTFADALDDDIKMPNGRRLSDALLARDQRINPEVAQIGELQRLTEAGYAKWKTTELTKLVIANSRGANSDLQLGGSTLRLVPSMATLYAYESYADSCGRAAGQTPEGGGSKKTTKTKKTTS